MRFWVLLLLFSAITGYAQHFQAGISGGLVASQYDGDGYAGYNKLGVSLGALVKRSFSEKWTAQFEILYVQKGAVHNPNIDKGDYIQYRLKVDYMEVPVLLKYQYKNLIIESGLGVGILINASETLNDIDVKQALPLGKYDLPFYLGIAYPFTENFEIGVRYTYSSLPLKTVPGTSYYANFGYANHNLITTSLRYCFGK